MANEYQAWKGAVEPAESSSSGNEYQAWKGAVEPAAATSGAAGIALLLRRRRGR